MYIKKIDVILVQSPFNWDWEVTHVLKNIAHPIWSKLVIFCLSKEAIACSKRRVDCLQAKALNRVVVTVGTYSWKRNNFSPGISLTRHT